MSAWKIEGRGLKSIGLRGGEMVLEVLLFEIELAMLSLRAAVAVDIVAALDSMPVLAVAARAAEALFLSPWR